MNNFIAYSDIVPSLNFSALTKEYETLSDTEKNTITQELTGTVKYINLEGGFYGIIGPNDEKYLPINKQKELLSLVGKEIILTEWFSKKDMVSIFVGTINIFV